MRVALTIAGSDPSGGAGLQADLKTFHQHGVFGAAAVTLITVQNTRSVARVEVLAPGLVAEQVEAVLADIPPHAVKTGALGDASVIAAVARIAARLTCPLVVDPVLVSKHGDPLLPPQAESALRELLLPHATLVTPNLFEAERLSGIAIADARAMEAAARAIAALGPASVLVKGGARLGGDTVVDLLWSRGRARFFEGPRSSSRSTHGTGCVLAAAITARLARGEELDAAVERAREFVRRAIETAPGLGGGVGPTNMLAPTP